MNEFFIDYYGNKDAGSWGVVSNKQGQNALDNDPSDPRLTKEEMEAGYNISLKDYPNIAEGGMPGTIYPPGNRNTKSGCKTAAYTSITALPAFVNGQRRGVNDGIYVEVGPLAYFSAYFIPIEKAFEAADWLRNYTLKVFNEEGKGFRFNQPQEFRFVDVDASKAILTQVPTGTYMVWDVLNFPASGSEDTWGLNYMEIEDYLLYQIGAKPHLGKLMAFGLDPATGIVSPSTSKRKATEVFSLQQKCLFEAYRAKQDPRGLFRSGYGVELLQVCDSLDSSVDCVLRQPTEAECSGLVPDACDGACGDNTECAEGKCVSSCPGSPCCSPGPKACGLASSAAVPACVCSFDDFCCNTEFDDQCVQEARDRCDLNC